jgi:hypothetical protein
MSYLLDMLICVVMILLDNLLQCLMFIAMIELSRTCDSTSTLICNTLIMFMIYLCIKIKLKVLLFTTGRWMEVVPLLQDYLNVFYGVTGASIGVRRSIRLASGCRWSLMDRSGIVLVGGSASRQPFRLSCEAFTSVNVASLFGGGRFCLTLTDFASHPGRCHEAVLASGLDGGGFEVGAPLLTSSCEVWILVSRV